MLISGKRSVIRPAILRSLILDLNSRQPAARPVSTTKVRYEFSDVAESKYEDSRGPIIVKSSTI